VDKFVDKIKQLYSFLRWKIFYWRVLRLSL